METHLRLTATDRKDSYGLVPLRLALMDPSGRELDNLLACSGQPYRQAFRAAANSQAGSMEPLGEGVYNISKAFWCGSPGDYETCYAAGLGPVVFDLDCRTHTGRGDLRVHQDGNRKLAPGTAGCVGLLNEVDLREFVAWMSEAGAPTRLVVDWSLGTIPRPEPAPLRVVDAASGKEIPCHPILVKGRTMVELRAFVEAMQGTVEIDGGTIRVSV